MANGDLTQSVQVQTKELMYRSQDEIENIASVSEENSAAVEEASASTEEMNAQVEGASASAQLLTEMAQGLHELVARFKLGHGEVNPAPEAEPDEQPAVYIGPDRRKAAIERILSGELMN